MRAIAIALLLLGAAAACQTAGTREPATPAIWTERVKLRLDEMYVADSRKIELRPIQIGINRAVLQVRSGGLSQRLEMLPGSIHGYRIGDYRIELVSTSIEPSVDLVISRVR